MKRATSIIFGAITMLLSVWGVSQNTVEEPRTNNLVAQLGPENILFGQENDPELSTLVPNNNSIYIRQIGSNNSINVNTKTGASDIELVQNGNGNSARLDLTSLTANEKINQNGNSHHFAEYVNTPNLNLKRTINQSGNSQNLVIHGNNSLSEKIRLNMQGNSGTVIIRNFN